MATSAARHFARAAISRSVIESLKTTKKCGTSQLLNAVKAKTASNTLKARCLSQFLPSLQIQAANNFPITTAVSNMLDNGVISKSNALMIAIIESELTSSSEELEDDEDAKCITCQSETPAVFLC